MQETSIVKETKKLIDENLTGKLSLDEIAKQLNYSKFYLNRLFAKEVGCTIHKYIQTRRLAKAAKQLAQTDQSIAWIAMEANYTSQQAFTLVFHQVYDCTPGEYRQRRLQLHKTVEMKQVRTTSRTARISCGSVRGMGGQMAA